MNGNFDRGGSPGEVNRSSRSDWMWVLVALVAAAVVAAVRYAPELKALLQRIPVPTTLPAVKPRVVAESVMSATVKPSFTLDLETGDTAALKAADLWWHFATKTDRSLDLRNSALMARIPDAGGRDFPAMDAAFLATLRYDLVRLPASGAGAEIKDGTVIAVRTTEGNLAKLRIRSAKPGLVALSVEWILYPAPPVAAAAAVATPAPEAGPVPKAPADQNQWPAKLQQGLEAYRNKRPDDAMALYAGALVAAKTFGADSPQVAFVVYRTGTLYWSMQRLNEAERTGVEALRVVLKLREADIQSKFGADRVYLVAEIYRGLVLIYRQQGRSDEALRAFGKSTAALEASTATGQPEFRAFTLAGGYLDLGSAQCTLLQWGPAKTSLAKAQAMAVKNAGGGAQLKAIDAQLQRVQQQAC